jgi:hypothetical protein
MSEIKIGFFASRVNFDPLKLRFSLYFYLFFFTHSCTFLISYILGIDQNVDINPSKLPQKLSVMKIGRSFSKSIVTP